MTGIIRTRPVAVDTARSTKARRWPLPLDAAHLSADFWETAGYGGEHILLHSGILAFG